MKWALLSFVNEEIGLENKVFLVIYLTYLFCIYCVLKDEDIVGGRYLCFWRLGVFRLVKGDRYLISNFINSFLGILEISVVKKKFEMLWE